LGDHESIALLFQVALSGMNEPTSRNEISSRISTTSRAFSFFSSLESFGGMLAELIVLWVSWRFVSSTALFIYTPMTEHWTFAVCNSESSEEHTTLHT
jgi:hypothetical protein